MNSQVDQYGKVAVVNLVDQAGKEKVIQDAFLKHIVQLNHKQVTYVAFDFHEYWLVYLYMQHLFYVYNFNHKIIMWKFVHLIKLMHIHFLKRKYHEICGCSLLGFEL